MDSLASFHPGVVRTVDWGSSLDRNGEVASYAGKSIVWHEGFEAGSPVNTEVGREEQSEEWLGSSMCAGRGQGGDSSCGGVDVPQELLNRVTTTS